MAPPEATEEALMSEVGRGMGSGDINYKLKNMDQRTLLGVQFLFLYPALSLIFLRLSFGREPTMYLTFFYSHKMLKSKRLSRKIVSWMDFDEALITEVEM